VKPIRSTHCLIAEWIVQAQTELDDVDVTVVSLLVTVPRGI